MAKLLKRDIDFKYFKSALNGIVMVFVSIFSVAVLRGIFFRNSEFIWSQNIKLDSSSLAPYIVPWSIERDGIEAYVMFALVVLSLAVSAGLWLLYRRIIALKSLRLRLALAFIFFVPLIYFVYNFVLQVGFTLPLPEKSPWMIASPIVISVFAYMLLILTLKKSYLWIADCALFLILIPVVFVSTTSISISWIDYEYIFAPALRILQGFGLKDIYFQYDVFLSLIALLFLKLKISLGYFPLLGQLSFYMFFLLSFIFAKRLFKNYMLPYFLLLTFVLLRVYAFKDDLVTVFQVTPLRLDLWLILAWIALVKGLSSKWIGITLALMLIFHHTFGLIYLISYSLTIFVDSALKFLDEKNFKDLSIELVKAYWFNIIVVIIGYSSYVLLFSSSSQGAGSLYQQIGIGFLPIAKTSFYWYVAVSFCTAMLLLLQFRKRLAKRYFQIGVFIIFLGLGNSIYFFGRSHENNILNIISSLVFIFYLIFDLCYDNLVVIKDRSKFPYYITGLVSVFFVALVISSYFGRMEKKIEIQSQNLDKIFTQHLASVPQCSLDKIKKSTNDSEKVYFMSQYDFYCDYQGGYIPQGYFNPYLSWVYRKDMIEFLQKLLNQGYYLVLPQNERQRDMEILDKLNYDKKTEDGDNIIISQQKD